MANTMVQSLSTLRTDGSDITPGPAPLIPALSNQQVQEMYRLMVDEYGIGQLVLLENVGRSLVTLARRMLGGKIAGRSVVIVAGAGNNGAGGLVAARCLASAGANLSVILAQTVPELEPPTAHQYRLLTRVGIHCLTQSDTPSLRITAQLRESDLILDTLIGGGLHSHPVGSEAFLVQVICQAGRPVLSLDLPSGLPPDGQPPVNPELVIRATATLALGLPRLAHTQPAAFDWLGELYLADIGIPSNCYTRLGLSVGPIFSASDILLLRKRPGLQFT